MESIAVKALILILAAWPATSTPLDVSHILKRNACDWQGSEPILYHDYVETDCPAPFKFADADGNCEMSGTTDGHFKPLCETYCQVRTTYFYGQEQIFLKNPYCFGTKGGMTCGITDTVTTTYTVSLNLSPAVKGDVLSLGITGGLQAAHATAHAQSYTVKLEENECGYWTFLPILKGVCGSYTKGTTQHDYLSGKVSCKDPSSTPNICLSTPQFAPGETSGLGTGDTVFVRTDCSNRQPLPSEQQNPAYNHPGVALPRSLYEIYSSQFVEEVGTGSPLSISSTITCESPPDIASSVDCDNALEILSRFPTTKISSPGGNEQGKKSGTYIWAAYVLSCAIELVFDQDWDPSCDLTRGEIYIAAMGIRNGCEFSTLGSSVSGHRIVRDDGKCNSHVRIGATAGRLSPS